AADTEMPIPMVGKQERERSGPGEPSASRREQIDHAAVWILYLRVALTPERVPRLLIAESASVRELSVETIDVVRRFAAERDCRPVATGRRRPRRIERPDRFLGVKR